MLTIDMADWGDVLFGRIHAAEVRGDLLRLLESAPEASIDFSRVENMSLSFADECFGELANELLCRPAPPRICFKGATSRIQASLRFALRDRTARDCIPA